jgi:hypothetical protein
MIVLRPSIRSGRSTKSIRFDTNHYGSTVGDALLVDEDEFSFSFKGLTEKNLTINKELFDAYDHVEDWRFQVIYSFEFQTIEQTFDVQINDRPRNGSCSIQPASGDLLTVFTIRCAEWHDDDGINDYLIYGLSDSLRRISKNFSCLGRQDASPSTLTFLSSSTESIWQLRLPSTLTLIIHIRDPFNCFTDFQLPSIQIDRDRSLLNDLLDGYSSMNPLMRALNDSDLYRVGQMISSIVEMLDEIDTTRLAISPLFSSNRSKVKNNGSSSYTSQEELNRYAHLRTYLMNLISNGSVDNEVDAIFQASMLSQLTQQTNQLTRSTAVKSLTVE